MAMKLRIDMTGVRCGRLVGISFAHKSRCGHAYWLFACDCGNTVVAAGSSVRAGSTASCGCLHPEISAARLTDHGHRARKRHDATYRAWQRMKVENDALAIWPPWRDDYAKFRDDLGERPIDTILIRVNASDPFGPDNCRWTSVASRADRAAQGWTKRRDSLPAQPSAFRTPTSQSKSVPAAAATMRASMAR